MMNLLLTFSLVSFFHSFHVSVLDMRWNKEEKTIECSARLFVDDLENVLKEKHKRPFDLAVNYAQESGKIEQYVREMVHIKVSGREAALEFLGVEREEDALWVHFYVPKLKRLRRLWVKNEIFTEHFDDQQNIVHVKAGKRESSHRLRRGEPSFELRFD